MAADRRKADLKYLYNISLDWLTAILDRQGGKCAICGRGSAKHLPVDHDHKCCPGRRSCGACVRGALCFDCNRTLLGQICQETRKGKTHAIAVLKRAITYLEADPVGTDLEIRRPA